MSPVHIVEEIVKNVRNHPVSDSSAKWVICENDLDDVRFFKGQKEGGYGADAQWCDDFHHSLRSLVTGSRAGYFEDFGTVAHLAKALRAGYVYSWQYSDHRRKWQGSDSSNIPGDRFVVFVQNHDQIGNASGGSRLSVLVDFEILKLCASTVFLSQNVPMLFMGEEYGEDNPFSFFVDYPEGPLAEGVRKGRAELGRTLGIDGMADPLSAKTYESSVLDWTKMGSERGSALLRLYKDLIRLRKVHPALRSRSRDDMEVIASGEDGLTMIRKGEGSTAVIMLNLSPGQVGMKLPAGHWTPVIDTSSEGYLGPGSSIRGRVLEGRVLMGPWSVRMLSREGAR
jgi:maltooligosyltrehalose trehalohydrolase